MLKDIKQLKMRLIVDDIHKLIIGHKNYNIEDMYSFLNDDFENKDSYRDLRI